MAFIMFTMLCIRFCFDLFVCSVFGLFLRLSFYHLPCTVLNHSKLHVLHVYIKPEVVSPQVENKIIKLLKRQVWNTIEHACLPVMIHELLLYMSTLFDNKYCLSGSMKCTVPA